MAESVLATALGLRGDNPKKLQEFTGNLEDYQRDVVAANTAITPDAAKLADMVNTANTEQLLKMMESILPGYQDLLKKGLGNAGQLMQGELPDDVKRAIVDFGAQRGITSGTSGSNFADLSTLRSFGLSSLDAEQRGLNQFLDISQRAPKAPMFDFTSMFLSPSQKAAFEMNKFNINLPIKQFNNWVDSLPSNLERAAGQFLDWVATEGTSVMNMYTGAGMGGGGGGGMGGGGGGGASESSSPWSSYPAGGFGLPGGSPEGQNQGTGEGWPMGGSFDNSTNWNPYFG